MIFWNKNQNANNEELTVLTSTEYEISLNLDFLIFFYKFTRVPNSAIVVLRVTEQFLTSEAFIAQGRHQGFCTTS